MPSYDYYKKYVSIVQVAEALGYELNKKAGKKPLEYKHPDQNTIVVSNRNGLERYFTRHESDNKGTVIDFVKHRLPLFNVYYAKEAEGINKVLSSFSGPANEPVKRRWQEERGDFNLKHFEIIDPKLHDLTYLSSERGLNRETLQTFMPHIELVRSKNHQVVNIGFPYQIPGEQKTVGFELVNFMFKGHARGSNRSEGAWVADLSQTGFPQSIILGESAIDAMSFYQLFRQKYTLNKSAFLSSGGYITDRQLRNILTHYPTSGVQTIFDNDLSGHLYDIRTACMKANKDLTIFYKNGMYRFTYNNNRNVNLNKDQVSLTNFRKATGIRTEVAVHKSKGKDFNEDLKTIEKGVHKSIKM